MVTRFNKTYLYKVYSGTSYLGLLPNVKSDFSYYQDLNTGFAQTSIEVAKSADNVRDPVRPLLDEITDAVITDENDQTLYEERQPQIFGTTGPTLIAPENTIKIYEISSENPTGLLVFNGWMTTIEARYGDDDTITILAMSKGCDLGEYLIGGTTTADQSQTTSTGTQSLQSIVGAYYGQTFVVGAGITTMSAIDLKIRSNSTTDVGVTVHLALGAPPPSGFPTDITSGYRTIPNGGGGTVDAVYRFTFPTPVNVSPGSTYFLWVEADALPGFPAVGLFTTSTDVYANGAAYAAVGGGAWGVQTFDLYFKTNYTDSGVTANFSAQDPTAILTAAVDIYAGLGGQANYNSTSTTLTALSVSYNFKLATCLDIIRKSLDLAPSDWYWYCDPGSLVIYFKQTATTATHKMIKGKHLASMKLRLTSDDIRNKLYFSGGPTAGVNLLTTYTNSNSASDRQRLATISDNRVTIQNTADAIADSYLDSHNSLTYQTQIKVPDKVYDISRFDLGETVGFEGFGSFVDALILQIVAITRHPDYVELRLGSLAPRLTTSQTQALRDISDIQTLDNPSTAS